MRYGNIREEELKNKIAHDYFWIYDCTKIIGNVDFCVAIHQSTQELFEYESLLWAEAKTGASDIYRSLVQLIITIGKARTFDKFLPPPMLGAFDGEKIAFIPYNDIHDIFYLNDFNWNVTPSNYETKEFQYIYDKVKTSIDTKALLFHFEKDDKDLKRFIKNNFVIGKFGLSKIKIDKNNFMIIYNKWLQSVKPTISVNWDIAKKSGLIDGDFYLADLLSIENETLKEKLFVLLKKDHYELDRKLSEMGLFTTSSTSYTDKQVAHTQFWNKYERPPKEEYWDYIVERRDLLVPQDIRERHGSFYTPQIWVELSQKYLTDVLGENWQDEFYIWDCAAGTGNLLTGLVNKYNIWASTLDTQDVDVMHERIDTMNEHSVSGDGANLLHDHVFQFDFLNDEFTKLPQGLQNIINAPEKRKKLVIYINPPYAEAGNIKERVGTGKGKSKTTTENKTYLKYKTLLGNASKELFTLFLIRMYREIPHCIIANFSKLKNLQSSNFAEFRNIFKANLEKIFIVPADSFDNVKGQFPIGFFIWDTKKAVKFEYIKADIYNSKQNLIGYKNIYSYDNFTGKINKWLNIYKSNTNDICLGYLMGDAPDFQSNNVISIESVKGTRHGIYFSVFQSNLIQASIYFAVRKCIEATWLNDRDQFLYPNDGWQDDKEFQNDCLAYTLFSNYISSQHGANHWIPFTEYEVGARDKFDSNFMSDYISGKLKPSIVSESLFEDYNTTLHVKPLEFSAEAQGVFNAGRELWKYYHKQPGCNVNASLYDIRAHFQGRNDQGKMNNKSEDEDYMNLINDLRVKLKLLAKKIEPKVYEYGFLKA